MHQDMVQHTYEISIIMRHRVLQHCPLSLPGENVCVRVSGRSIALACTSEVGDVKRKRPM